MNESWAGSCNEFRFEYPISNTPVKGKISAGGTQKCDSGVHVWIVLSDGFGYYLQSPEVSLYKNGKWNQDAINISDGIKSIIAILVNEDGHKYFKQKEKNGEWGQFKDIPAGYEKLSVVEINK